jgi:hypothetical protein
MGVDEMRRLNKNAFISVVFVLAYVFFLFGCAPPRATYHKDEAAQMVWLQCFNGGRMVYSANGWVSGRTAQGFTFRENTPGSREMFITLDCIER